MTSQTEAHVFPAAIEDAEGTRCERCGMIWAGRWVMTCSETAVYLAEHGFPIESTA
jgi:hypothetical protein